MKGYIVTHPGYGEGKVTDVEGRLLRVRFLEDGQERLLSSSTIRDGVIQRSRVRAGTVCSSERGECTVRGRVEEPDRHGPWLYEVEYCNGLRGVISEIELTAIRPPTYDCPADLLASLDPQGYALFAAREALAEAVSKLLRAGSGLRALLSSRIDLRPHQAYVAGVVILDRVRRYVLADEVGLGKTIEAGLVIHDLLWKNPNARVLILCPGALTQQWLCELYSKFGGQVFRLLDLHDPTSIRDADLRKAIVSTTLGAYKLADRLVSTKWELVVIDEAHHLLSSPILYELAERLARRVPSLLLLSAIPARRREDEFLRLLALLEPDRYASLDTSARRAFGSIYAAQVAIGRRLRRLSSKLDGFESGKMQPDDVLAVAKRLLELPAMDQDADVRSRIRALEERPAELASIARELLHDVGDRFRINRRILRNRRSRLVHENQIEAITREFSGLPYEAEQLERNVVASVRALLASLAESGLTHDVLLPFARVALQSLALPSSAKEFIERLQRAKPHDINRLGLDFLAAGPTVGYAEWERYRDLACSAVRRSVDCTLLEEAADRAAAWCRTRRGISRVARLVAFLEECQAAQRRPKMLVFAGFPGAAKELAGHLRTTFGNEAVKEFRFDLEQEDKEQNALRFRTNPGSWLLVSDETGGEGRNFQFADAVVHFDTPWHCAQVEQRIGRLDRLGREHYRRDVVSHVLYDEGSLEAGLVECYRDGLGVYTRSMSGLEFALRDVEDRLTATAIECGFDGLSQAVTQLATTANQERQRDDADAVLDEASFECNTAARFQRVSLAQASEPDLERAFIGYVQLIAEATAVSDSAFPQGIWRLSCDTTRNGVKLVSDTRAGTTFGDVKGTFRREIAQLRPDLNFFSIGNPLFDAVLDSLATQVTGRTYAVECIVADRAPWLGFEFVYRAEPRLSAVREPGLANQVLEAFVPRSRRVFVDVDGAIEADDSRLLAVRRSLTKAQKGRTWWNLTKDKADCLPLALGGRDWQVTFSSLEAQAARDAREALEETVRLDLQSEVRRIDNELTCARAKKTLARPEDVDGLEAVVEALTSWQVRLDSVGFLSVNGNLLRR